MEPPWALEAWSRPFRSQWVQVMMKCITCPFCTVTKLVDKPLSREHSMPCGKACRNENAKDKTTAGLQRSEKLRLFDMQRTRVLAIKRSFLLSQAQVSSTHTPPWFASTDPVRCSSSTVE